MSLQDDNQHNSTRDFLRILGPVVVITGAIFAIIGIGNFFSSFGSFEPPKYFWCAFIGLPLIGGGLGICKFAYMGAITRYMANEVAPVGKDVVNYMADGTKGAVRNVATAVGEGIRAGFSPTEKAILHCNHCHTDNQAPANFCKSCGKSLAATRSCGGCGKANEPDSRYCDHCGKVLI